MILFTAQLVPESYLQICQIIDKLQSKTLCLEKTNLARNFSLEQQKQYILPPVSSEWWPTCLGMKTLDGPSGRLAPLQQLPRCPMWFFWEEYLSKISSSTPIHRAPPPSQRNHASSLIPLLTPGSALLPPQNTLAMMFTFILVRMSLIISPSLMS